jgi:hypothetical protein
MPLLAAFFGSAFAAILDFFLKYMTRKVAMYATVVTAVTALTAALYLAFTAIFTGIAVSLPADVASLSAFFPDNLRACMSAYASAAILKWTYDWNAGFIQRALF